MAVDAYALETRVKVAVAGGLLDAQQLEVVKGVQWHITKARDAAFGDDPIPRRWGNWWKGVLVEAAYRHLHAARAQIIDLLGPEELRAEVPAAIARAEPLLGRADPRLITPDDVTSGATQLLRARLRRLLDDTYEILDRQHAQLRSFRNIVLMSSLVTSLLVLATVVVVSTHPKVMPLCFPNEVRVAGQPGVTTVVGDNCPTHNGPATSLATVTTSGPSVGDVLIVSLLGLLGGALAAAVSIRNLKGTSTPYDVPVALAALKVPLGAFTAIVALVAIRGDFIPGLSVLDSQEQILAYALIFGFAQQVFTRLLDQRAQNLLEGLPTKDASPMADALRSPAQDGRKAPEEPAQDGTLGDA